MYIYIYTYIYVYIYIYIYIYLFVFINRGRTGHGVCAESGRGVCSKALALIWYRALTWYSSPARPFAALDDPLLVTGQQETPSPACQQLSRARNACAGSSSEENTKLKHGTKLGPTLCYLRHGPSSCSTCVV